MKVSGGFNGKPTTRGKVLATVARWKQASMNLRGLILNRNETFEG